MTVETVGSHDGPIGYAGFVEPLPASLNCSGLAYFDITTVLGRSFLATLTVAMTTGRRVRIWVRARTNEDPSCRLLLVRLR